MLRWFVTGAGGQLATAFTGVLKGEVFLAREDAIDIRDADAVRAAVRAFAPDVILHTAAYTDVDGAEANAAAAEAVNVDGTRNMIRAVRGTHTTVVYFSTDYVFNGEKGAPYVESDATGPLSVYGRTKLAGEQAVLEWVHGIVIRTAGLHSASGTNFVKTILRAARERAASGEPLRVVDDQVVSPTYAGHLAAAVGEILRLEIDAGVYHLANGGFCSWYELAREVVALASLEVSVEPITTAELGRAAPRPAFSALATERPIPRLPDWPDGAAACVDALLAQDGDAS